MKTLSKTTSKTRLNTKQKVVVGVSIGAMVFALGGFLSAMGKARGFGFGYPFLKRPVKKVEMFDRGRDAERQNANMPTPYGNIKTTTMPPVVKTMLPKYNEWCTIRSSTGGTMQVLCDSLKK